MNKSLSDLSLPRRKLIPGEPTLFDIRNQLQIGQYFIASMYIYQIVSTSPSVGVCLLAGIGDSWVDFSNIPQSIRTNNGNSIRVDQIKFITCDELVELKLSI